MKIKKWQLDVEVQLITLDTMEVFILIALIDSECTNSCIKQTFIENKKINTQNYKNPILYYNADGFQNKARTIIEFVKVKLNIEDHSEQIHLVVVNYKRQACFWDMTGSRSII